MAKAKTIRMKQGEIWQCVNPAAISLFESMNRMMTMKTILVVNDHGDYYHVYPVDLMATGYSFDELQNLKYTHKQFADFLSQGHIKKVKGIPLSDMKWQLI